MSSYSTKKSSGINQMHIDNNLSWQYSLGIQTSETLLLIQFWYLCWLGCISGIDQMYLLLGLTCPFPRCIFGWAAALKWVWSQILRTRVADVNRFVTVLNTLVVKSLLVLRLRAVWNKDLIGKRAKSIWQWTHYVDFFLNSSHTHSIFYDGRYVLWNLIYDW